MRSTDGEGRAPSFERYFLAAALVIAAGMGFARIIGVFTANVNWDEFALLQRAEELARFGELRGSGRPGLANLALAPFAESCVDGLGALVRNRFPWTEYVAAAVVGGTMPGGSHCWPTIESTGLRVDGRHLHAGEDTGPNDWPGVVWTPTDPSGGSAPLEVATPFRADTTRFFTLFLERGERPALDHLPDVGG